MAAEPGLNLPRKDAPRALEPTDMPNRRLGWTLAAALGTIVAWFALRGPLPVEWGTPGSPPLYVAGLLGAALVLVPVAFALAKRGGRSERPVAWFNAHVVCTCAGSALIAVHSAGHVGRAPALLLLSLLALAVLGVWGRLAGARAMARTFASKVARFGRPDEATRERLRALISRKRRLLAELDPPADEATFSVTLSHLAWRPRLALRYLALSREEARLLGTRAAVGPAQAWWRPLHMALAWLFVVGVVVHVVTVTFFAGYVADYGPVTWWHLTAW